MSLFSPSVHRMHREKCSLSSNTQTFLSTLRLNICISPAPRSQPQSLLLPPIKQNPKQYVIPWNEYNNDNNDDYFLNNSDSDSDDDANDAWLYDDNIYDIELTNLYIQPDDSA